MGIIYEDALVQIVETVTPNGRTVQTIDKPGSPGAIATSLRDKANAAIAANNTYIALPSPTAGQTTAQVQRLSRECNALIRLMLSRFDADDA